MVKMTKKQKTDLQKFGMIAKGNNIKYLLRSFKKKKKKNQFPPQDTSTDIILGDPDEDYRY